VFGQTDAPPWPGRMQKTGCRNKPSSSTEMRGCI
jgi:hypothetical protein